MSEILPILTKRRAWRAIDTKPVSRKDVELLVNAAHLAPSCFNNQPWRFVAIDDQKILNQIKDTLPKTNAWIKRAPVIIGVFSKSDLDCKLSDNRDYFLLGCGMAIGNMMAQATSMELICHPIAGFDPIKVKDILKIPQDFILITLVIVGYRSQDMSLLTDQQKERESGPRIRKPLEEVLFWNEYQSVSQEMPKEKQRTM